MSENQTNERIRQKKVEELRIKAALLEACTSDPNLNARRREELEAVSLSDLVAAKERAAVDLYERLRQDPRAIKISQNDSHWQITLPSSSEEGASITLRAKGDFQRRLPLVRIYTGEASVELEADPESETDMTGGSVVKIGSLKPYDKTNGSFGMLVATLSIRDMVDEVGDVLLLESLSEQLEPAHDAHAAALAGGVALRALQS